MRFPGLAVLLLALALPCCTAIERSAHMYSASAPEPHVFQYRDGGSSIYYAFTLGDPSALDTAVFFYGGSGCPSWKSVMPGYVDGLAVSARVFFLIKRFVADRSTGASGCGGDFDLANNPGQWVADYSEFITDQVNLLAPRPRNIVLVGVSEGAIPAARIAARLPVGVTHLVIIGSGGYSLRQSLATLKAKGAIGFDVDSGWRKVATDPRSIEKTWYGSPYRWWSDVIDIDPLPDLLRLDIPVIVGFGEKDESVPVESVHLLESAFTQSGKHNLTVKVYPGADHRLNADGVSYRESFFAQLSQWLR
jgi:pimeloyl-ACP methyl ester carboxylesterase